MRQLAREKTYLSCALCAVVLAGPASSCRTRSAQQVVFVRAELRDRLAQALDCDDDEVWIGSFEAATRRAYISRLTRGSVWQEQAIGQGVVSGLSRVGDAAWAVLVPGEVAGAFNEAGGTLFRSRDGGRSWTPVPTPTGVIGVAFADAANGYAWSNSAVLVTRDAGEHWDEVAVSPVALERNTGVSSPFLDRDGSLWAPGRISPQDRTESVLLRFAGRPVAVQAGVWHGAALQGVALRRDGALLYGASDPTRGGFTIFERSPGARERAVRTWPTRSGVLRARGSALLVELIDGPWPSGFFGSISSKRLISADGGLSWSEESTTGEEVAATCIADHGYWTVQKSGGVAFRPFASKQLR